MEAKNRLIRITTVPMSLLTLISGQMGYMAAHGFEVFMVSSDFEGKAELEEKEKSLYIPVEMSRSITPIADLMALLRLIRLFRKLKPAIVHSHTPKAGLLGMLAGKLSGVPIRLHTVAGLPLMESHGAKKLLLEMVEKLAYRCATRVYPNSLKLRDIILDFRFCKASKLKVIGGGSSNGINSSIFSRSPRLEIEADQLRKFLQIPQGHFVYIYVGRLVGDKGVAELVSAFTQMNRSNPNTWLLLVGPEEAHLDPLPMECLQTIRRHPKIRTVPFQADVRPYLALSHVLVLASYREGFPNVPMQAGCFHLPCIVSDINGCNEIIHHEENGLLVPAKDTAALCKAMERLYADQQLYLKLAANARKMITERYEQQQVWESLLAEYQTLLNLKAQRCTNTENA